MSVEILEKEQQLELIEKALREAVLTAIDIMGLEAFKKTSWFPSSLKGERNGTTDEIFLRRLRGERKSLEY